MLEFVHRMQFKVIERNKRSIVKSISYRVVSLMADSTAAYLFTHSISATAGIVIFVNTYSTILYYLHERVWAHIHWGHSTPLPSTAPRVS